jgi:glycosyltransferase involved in cell wall biosynthesis
MGVFNEIEYDGRVQRSAQALSDDFDVTVCCIDSGKPYRDPRFHTVQIRSPKWAEGKAFKHACFWLRFILEAWKRHPSIVYAHDYYMLLPGWCASRCAGAGLVYDAHELLLGGKGKKLPRRERAFSMIERAFIRGASLVIAANNERAGRMRKRFRLTKSPLVIQNISMRPEKEDDSADRLPSDRVRLVYEGDINLARGVGLFISAMRYLDDRYELVIVGSGPDEMKCRGLAGEESISRKVRFLGKLPRASLHGILKTCTIGIVTYSFKGWNNLYCAPNKTFEYAQAGLPLLCTAQPPLRALLERYKIGICVEWGSDDEAPGKIASAVSMLGANLTDYTRNLASFLEAENWEREKDKLIHGVSGIAR